MTTRDKTNSTWFIFLYSMIFSLFEMNTFEWKNISLHHSNHWRRHCDGLTGFIYFSSTMKKFKFTFVFSLKFSFLREMKYTTNASLKSIKMWQMVCDKLTEGGSMIWMVHLFLDWFFKIDSLRLRFLVRGFRIVRWYSWHTQYRNFLKMIIWMG